MEANADLYTFVLGRAIKTSKERIAKQLEEMWQYTQQNAKEELKDTGPTHYKSLDPEEVRKTVGQIDEALKDNPASPKVKQKVKYAKKNWPEKLKEYQMKEELLGKRNSYSKTDLAATFMRMKEAHMLNGQLKPGYNAQISTNNQIIITYTVHQISTETLTLEPHLESYKQELGFMPKELTADAAYGSEENYEFMEKNFIESYAKYNYFDQEQQNGGQSKGPFHADNLYYNKERNYCYCPMSQVMTFIGTKEDITESGYK
jgi:hypothetical protein